MRKKRNKWQYWYVVYISKVGYAISYTSKWIESTNKEFQYEYAKSLVEDKNAVILNWKKTTKGVRDAMKKISEEIK